MKPILLTVLVLCCGCSTAEIATESKPSADQVPSGESPKFTDKGHTTDSLEVVKATVQQDQAVLIDVREQKEWDDGHLQDATLIPMSLFKSDALTAEMKAQLPKDKPIYLHCAAGGRVLTVAEILKTDGYDVRPLKAGYRDLVKEGFATDSE